MKDHILNNKDATPPHKPDCAVFWEPSNDSGIGGFNYPCNCGAIPSPQPAEEFLETLETIAAKLDKYADELGCSDRAGELTWLANACRAIFEQIVVIEKGAGILHDKLVVTQREKVELERQNEKMGAEWHATVMQKQAAEAALQRLAAKEECGCDHSDENCCAKVGERCATCELAVLVKQSRKEK